MTSRTDPNLTDKLCAMILLWLEVPHEIACTLDRRRILSLVQWDHWPVPVAIAKDLNWEPAAYNHPSNLMPLIAEKHAIKTAKHDVPQIAKADRIREAHEEFRRRILAKSGTATDQPDHDRKLSRWGTRKMQSRPFQKRKAPTS